MAILIGKDSKLRPVSRAIHQAGVFLNPVVYPAVGKNASRLRISLSACHTRQELDRGLEVLTSVCKAYNII